MVAKLLIACYSYCEWRCHPGGKIVQVLLSFNEEDVAIAEAFRANLFVWAPDVEFFFSPVLFEGYRTLQLKDADAFLLMVGPRGFGESQLREHHLATLRCKNDNNFTVVRVAAGANVRQNLSRSGLAWVEVPIVTDRAMIQQVIDALNSRTKFIEQSRTKNCSFLRRLRVG